jgi:hypothetical protein
VWRFDTSLNPEITIEIVDRISEAGLEKRKKTLEAAWQGSKYGDYDNEEFECRWTFILIFESILVSFVCAELGRC